MPLALLDGAKADVLVLLWHVLALCSDDYCSAVLACAHTVAW